MLVLRARLEVVHTGPELAAIVRRYAEEQNVVDALAMRALADALDHATVRPTPHDGLHRAGRRFLISDAELNRRAERAMAEEGA